MKRFLHTLCLVLLPAVALAQDLSLEECISMGLLRSNTLQNAGYSLSEAKAVRSEARWEYFPKARIMGFGFQAMDPLVKITLGDVLGSSDGAQVLREEITAYATENGIKPYYSGYQHGIGLGMNAVQPLYAGGRIVTGNALADLGVSSGEIQLRMTRRAIRDSIERKYWAIVALQEKEKTLQEADALLEELEKEVSSALRSGVATETDLLQVQLKRRSLEAGKSRLQGGMTLLKMDFLEEIGCPYSFAGLQSVRLSDNLDMQEGPSRWTDEGAEDAPSDESRLLDMQVKARQLEKKMAVGELLPQVAIGAGYGYSAFTTLQKGSFNGWMFATVQIPLTDIGKAGTRARRYDYRIQQARGDRDYLDAKLQVQVKMLRLEMETAWQELEVSRDAVTLAEKTLSHMHTAFSSGRATTADYLQAQLSFIQAREDLVGREIAYRLAVNAYLSRIRQDSLQVSE